MILTPILGAMAYKQEQPARRSTASPRATAQWPYTTVIAYGASIIAVSWPIHLKFWEK